MRTRFLRRGQTLVLFALTLLLVALMVVMTLSFSVKVRERIELQTAADTTAFSNAVATARTFNNIAVLSRAQIAHGVAQLGAQSLVSWTTMYRSYLNGTKKAFKNSEKLYQYNKDFGCPCAKKERCARMCRCGTKGLNDLQKLQNELQKEDDRVDKIFKSMDAAAGRQVLFMQVAQAALYAEQQEVYRRLVDKLNSQELAEPILDKLAEGGTRGEWSAPPAAGEVSEEEVSGGVFCKDSGAVCDPMPLTVAHAVNAAMGSRGWRFTTHRKLEDYAPHQENLQRVILPPDQVTIVRGEGTSFFSEDGAASLLPPYAPAAAALDEGSINTVYEHTAHGGGPPCPSTWGETIGQEDIKVELKGGAKPVHTWMGGKDDSAFVHFLTPCSGGPSSCPGVWPAFLDYNLRQVANERNNFGQPKNFAVIRRDASVRGPDPWNLLYKLEFTRTDKLDARLDSPGRSVSTALSTGIAYYHRGSSLPISTPVIGGDHWSEPPNLLNPYWRATLIAPDVDNKGPADAVRTLNSSGAGEYARAFEALLNQGYGGYR